MIHREFLGRIALVSSSVRSPSCSCILSLPSSRQRRSCSSTTGKIFGSTITAIATRLSRVSAHKRAGPRGPTTRRAHRKSTDSGLWLREPDKCCAIRKVAPLARALRGFEAWISGRKRYQGGLRAKLPLVEADGDRIKINPLAEWSREDVTAYRELHSLPEHPLVAEGFRSIGCMPCTSASRKGRRANRPLARARQDRCGIHLGLQPSDGRQRHMSDAANPFGGTRLPPDEGFASRQRSGCPRRATAARAVCRVHRRRSGSLAIEGRCGRVSAGASAAALEHTLAAVADCARLPKFSDGRSYSAGGCCASATTFKVS